MQGNSAAQPASERSTAMRILFTFAGGAGHLEPLLPLARAAADAGHTAAFAARPWMVASAEANGFAAFPAGSDLGLAPVPRPLLAFDAERELRAVAAGFGLRIARERAADLVPLCAAWKPDLFVCEELDYGAMLVAERLGVPHAMVLVIAAGGFVRTALVAPALDAVRAEHGLAPDPMLETPGRHLVLSPFPPSYRSPEAPFPPDAHPFRLHSSDRADAAAPQWLADRGDAPLVYVTLGTVFNVECGDLFDRVLAGLRDLPIEVVVTVGRDVDPAELGPQPANVHVERFVPQARLLPHCSAVISHGGSGSVLGALAHGLPMVLLPIGADQPWNAARCEALGVARALDAMTATPDEIGACVADVLASESLRLAAERMRAEIEALPGPESALAQLERLAR